MIHLWSLLQHSTIRSSTAKASSWRALLDDFHFLLKVMQLPVLGSLGWVGRKNKKWHPHNSAALPSSLATTDHPSRDQTKGPSADWPCPVRWPFGRNISTENRAAQAFRFLFRLTSTSKNSINSSGMHWRWMPLFFLLYKNPFNSSHSAFCVFPFREEWWQHLA